jgi:hypothetical protein
MGRYLVLLGLLLCLSRPVLAHAVPMLNDPNGFQSLAWGVALTTRPDLEIARAGPHVNEYQLKNGPPLYAGVPVESLRFLSVDEQFARVTIHYRGRIVTNRSLPIWSNSSVPLSESQGR